MNVECEYYNASGQVQHAFYRYDLTSREAQDLLDLILNPRIKPVIDGRWHRVVVS